MFGIDFIRNFYAYMYVNHVNHYDVRSRKNNYACRKNTDGTKTMIRDVYFTKRRNAMLFLEWKYIYCHQNLGFESLLYYYYTYTYIE